MYVLVSFLCLLASVIIVALLQNFNTLNAATAIFLSLFPLGFIAASILIKRNALKTGATSNYKIMFKAIGLLLVIITLGFGGLNPFLKIWTSAHEGWVKPLLFWLAVLAVTDVLNLIIELPRESKRLRIKKLQES